MPDDKLPISEPINEDSDESAEVEIAQPQPVPVEPLIEEKKIEEIIEAPPTVEAFDVPTVPVLEEPIVEIPAPPRPEPIIEISKPLPETMPAPATEISLPIPRAPEPDPIPAPEPSLVQPATPAVAPTPQAERPATPPIAPTPSHLTEKQIKRDEPVVPAKHDPKYIKDIPKRVLELTDEEINAARLLWAREHIAGAQKQSNLNRKINMNKIMSEIEAVVRANPNTTTHAIANSVKLSEKSTSGYIQKLVKAGRIKAAGNSRNRRYFV